MNIYDYLRKDHRKVGEMLGKIEDTKNATKRMSLFDEMKLALLTHSEMEEATFYAALKDQRLTKDTVIHSEADHDEIKDYLNTLSEMNIANKKWMQQFSQLKSRIQKHVSDEEGATFTQAKSILSSKQAQDLATQMDALKRKHLKKAA